VQGEESCLNESINIRCEGGPSDNCLFGSCLKVFSNLKAICLLFCICEYRNNENYYVMKYAIVYLIRNVGDGNIINLSM